MLPSAAIMSAPKPPPPLVAYLSAKDPAYRWRYRERTERRDTIELVSGTALGRTWTHEILVQRPVRPAPGVRGAILFVTGDGPAAGDELDLNLLSNASGLTIAMLFDVPNQPIAFDGGPGRREDDLIAETFARHLDDGRTPPLLFPMARAAIRAMDAVEAATGLKRFVVTGASKRGWTTWLAGVSGDPRIAGIAPMVYDNLHLSAQMARQRRAWGRYSEMIEDYTARGLQARLETPAGRRLADSVDPYSMLDRLRAPVLAVNGTNDRYWTVDSLKEYWPAVKTPKWILEVPNNPHGLGDRARLVATVGAFARAALGGKVADPGWTFARKGDRVVFGVSGVPGLARLDVWQASSPTTDFREAKWTRGPLAEAFDAFRKGHEPSGAPSSIALGVPLRGEGRHAVFAEATVREAGGRTFTISSPVEVLPR